MEYRPQLPKHNNNISHEHPLKDFFILVAGLLGIGVVAFIVLGLLVDVVVGRISPETESRWFRDTPLSEAISQSLNDGSELTPFEFSMFEELKLCSGINVPISVYLSSSDELNAVAIPGGNIIVFQGLVDSLSSENGLAFVLAHELAHFKHRDHLRAMGRGLVFVAASSLVTGSQSSLTHFVGSLSNLQFSHYSQSRESAADTSALDILNCAYGHVAGAEEFFVSIEGNQDDFTMMHYFSTHPEVEERIMDIQRHINANGFRLDAVVPIDGKSVNEDLNRVSE